jgi:hypothetical protein
MALGGGDMELFYGDNGGCPGLEGASNDSIS